MASEEGTTEYPQGPPWPEANGIWADYDLHCHCGANRVSMKVSPPLYKEHAEGKEIYTVVECSCSMCERNGTQALHPLVENVKWERKDLTEYWTAGKNCPHFFCSKCGSHMGADMSKFMESQGMPPRIMLNMRMLKDYDRSKLKIEPVTYMKNMPPKYSID